MDYDDALRSEMEAVKQLGDEIGYGSLICWASALWRDLLRNRGIPESGAFIGVCENSIKESHLQEILKTEAVYDFLVQKNKGE